VFLKVSEKKEDTGFHKRTKRVNECEIYTNNTEEEDPVVVQLTKLGCLELHYKVQDCYFDHKDWRKCTAEVKQFQECMKAGKEKQKK
jgi:cytochrome c oxidase assembly factor 4